jgi:hypothetical protein
MRRNALSGSTRPIRVAVNSPPLTAASHTSSNSSAARLSAHDRFVGRAERGEHARDIILLILAFEHFQAE